MWLVRNCSLDCIDSCFNSVAMPCRGSKCSFANDMAIRDTGLLFLHRNLLEKDIFSHNCEQGYLNKAIHTD